MYTTQARDHKLGPADVHAQQCHNAVCQRTCGSQQCFCFDGLMIYRSKIGLFENHISLFLGALRNNKERKTQNRPFSTVFRQNQRCAAFFGSRGRSTVEIS